MKYYEELTDDTDGTAIQKLNDLFKWHEVKVVGYQVARYEALNLDRPYILVEVSE